MTARTETAQSQAAHTVRGPVGVILTIALVAALLLIVAEFSTIASVSVDGESCEVLNDTNSELADRCSLSGWERHGGALIVLALLMLGAAVAARRGVTREIGAVLLAIGLITLGLTLIGDLPVTNDAGAIGNDFDNATGSAGFGFYLELLGGALCVAAGMLGLVTSRERRSDAQAAQGETGDQLDRSAHDEGDAREQRQRAEADVGVRDDDHSGGDPDHAEDRREDAVTGLAEGAREVGDADHHEPEGDDDQQRQDAGAGTDEADEPGEDRQETDDQA